MISCSHCGISDAHKEDCRVAAVSLAEMTRVLMEMRHTWPEDDAMTVLLSEAIEAVGAVRTAYDFEIEMQNVPERARAMILGQATKKRHIAD